VALAKNNDDVPDVWVADLAVGALGERMRTNQAVISDEIASATAVGPGSSGAQVTSNLGLGAVSLGQVFDSPSDAVLTSQVNTVAQQFGLKVSSLSILHPLESALQVTFVVPDSATIDWTLDQLRTALVGASPDVEGVLIELDNSAGQPLLLAGVAYRTGEGGLWFAPGQDVRFGAVHGDRLVREVVFPVAPQPVLRELVAEFKASGPTYQRTVKATLRASYTNHYRVGLIKLLDVLEFRSNNTAHRPVLDALELIRRYANAGNLRHYPAGEHIPVHRGLSGDWHALVHTTDTRGRRRAVRMVYEICTFQALREQLRCKEIWVVGADKWRNPAEDLPADFGDRRAEHYHALRKPVDATAFVDELREQMRTELDALHQALPTCDWLSITDRAGGAIKLTPLDAAPEPRNLRRLKQAVQARWGTVPLIDMLKEAVLRTGCLRSVTSVAGHGSLPEHVLAERLLLAIYGYGTNTGIRAVAAGEHGHGEDEIRYARRRYLTAEAPRQIAIEIANATFTARQQTLWGDGSAAVASDSTHFGAFDQNIFTEWHSRYGGRGVLIYWHVE